MAQGPTPEQRKQLGAVGVASGLGCAIVACLVVFIGGGVFLDQWLDTSPIFTLSGVAVGLIAAGYQLYELAQIGRTDRQAPPLTRGMARLSGRRGPRDDA